MKKYQKGFSPIVVLLLIVLVGGIYYFVVKNKNTTPSSPSTSQANVTQNGVWKTYTNKDLGFSFDFPAVFKIVDDAGFQIVDFTVDTFFIGESNLGIAIYDGYPIYESKPGLFLSVYRTSKSVDQFVDNILTNDQKTWSAQKDSLNPGAIDSSKGPKTISITEISNKNGIYGKKVERLAVDTAPGTYYVEYVFKNNDNIYLLSSRFDRKFKVDSQYKGNYSTDKDFNDLLPSSSQIYYSLEEAFNSFKFTQ